MSVPTPKRVESRPNRFQIRSHFYFLYFLNVDYFHIQGQIVSIAKLSKLFSHTRKNFLDLLNDLSFKMQRVFMAQLP